MKVFIDPGHGGQDSGAVGPTGYREADFNIETSVLLGILLTRHGHEIQFSHDGVDPGKMPNLTRARLANIWKADVFISIHANGFYKIVDNDTFGMEVLYWNTSNRGLELADNIRDGLVSAFGNEIFDRGSKAKYNGDRGATVLSETDMPCVIIEPGFITDPDDEVWLRKFSTQARICEAVVAAIERL